MCLCRHPLLLQKLQKQDCQVGCMTGTASCLAVAPCHVLLLMYCLQRRVQLMLRVGCWQQLQVLIDAVVHAVNEDYDEMAGDFIKLGFLSPGEWAGAVGLGNSSSERGASLLIESSGFPLWLQFLDISGFGQEKKSCCCCMARLIATHLHQHAICPSRTPFTMW